MTPPVAQNSFTVVVKKVDTSLGINVIQKGSGIFIKNLVPDGPASKSPKIRPGRNRPDQKILLSDWLITSHVT